MEFTFSGEIFEWRGPSPFYFVAVDKDTHSGVSDVASHASYGWGAIPVVLIIDDHTWTTSIFPKDGRYVVPLKVAIRKKLELECGSRVTITLQFS